MLIVMATKDSTPSMQSRSATTQWTVEESVTPVIKPSGLGELSTSMVTETDRKLEVIQRAQVSSLMGSDKTKELPEKTPQKQSPWLLNPRSMPWRCGWKSKLAWACTPPLRKTLSVDFAIDYPGCTGMYLDMAGHMLAFYTKKTNPRAGLLHDQGIIVSKAIANIPTWMGYFTRWRV